MIVPMTRVRILGPLQERAGVLRALQNLAVVHLATPTGPSLASTRWTASEQREVQHVRRALDDVDTALARLDSSGTYRDGHAKPLAIPTAARRARKVRRQVERLDARVADLRDESALLNQYSQLLSTFEQAIRLESSWPD